MCVGSHFYSHGAVVTGAESPIHFLVRHWCMVNTWSWFKHPCNKLFRGLPVVLVAVSNR